MGFRPKVLCKRGIYESPYWSMTAPKAFALLAVASWGQCVDFAFVANEREYAVETERLQGILDEVDPLDSAKAGITRRVNRVSSVRYGDLKLAR